MTRWRFLALVGLGSIGLGCRAPRETLSPVALTVVGTNDLHGWVMPHRLTRPDGVEVEEGGSATFAGYLNILRKENPGGVLLLDAGDMFQGTLAANLTEGSVVIRVMNALGYQAAALGNHEFDYGPEGVASIATEASQDPFGALKRRMSEAHFPLLGGNVHEAASGSRPAWIQNAGMHSLTVQGIRVGVVGLVTPTTPQTTNPMNVKTLRFGALATEALSGACSLRAQGAQVVMLAVHAGGKCPSLKNPKDTSACDRNDSEIFELMESLPPGTFDAVVAGHTHAALGHFVKGTPVIETSGLGRSFGIVRLFVDPQTGKVLDERTVIEPSIPVCARVDSELGSCDAVRLADKPRISWMPAMFRGLPVVPDPAVAAVIAPALVEVEKQQRAPLRLHATEPLKRRYEAESALGDFLTDSLRDMESADVALWNSGGLRADLRAGELQYGDIYEVLPFDNTVATLRLTREELGRLLDAAYRAKKGVFQISGASVSLTRCGGIQRLSAFSVTGHNPGLLRVVMPDFLARGGDGLGAFLATLPSDRVDFGVSRSSNIRDELIRHWQHEGRTLKAPALGRIHIVADDSACRQ